MAKIDDLRIDLPVAKPRHKARFPLGAVIIVLLLVVVAAWLFRGQLTGVLDFASQGTQKVSIHVIAADRPSQPGSFSAGGYLEVIPPGPEVVSTLVAGKVQELTAIPGQLVEAGEVIARLDSSLYARRAATLGSRVRLAQARLTRLEAGFRSEEIAEAEAALNRALARLTQAEANYLREEELYSKGVSAHKELDVARADFEQAQADMAAAESRLALKRAGTRVEDINIAQAEVSAAQSELAEVQLLIAECEIKATVGGLVYELFTQPGSWVTPATDRADSGAIISIYDPAQVQAWVDVNQRDSSGLFSGQQVELISDVDPGRQVLGVVDRIMPQASLQKNTVQAKIAIPEPPADFRPELSVKVTFLPLDIDPAATKNEPGYWVPSTAITSREGESGVFLLSDGRSRWRKVEVADADEANTLVSDGLSPGEQVILAPASLRDGQAVELEGASE